MALKTKHITERKNGTYVITVEDTSMQTGTNEKGDPIYQTFSVIHNLVDGDTVLKEKVANKVKKSKQEQEAIATMKAKINSTLAEIDYSKL